MWKGGRETATIRGTGDVPALRWALTPAPDILKRRQLIDYLQYRGYRRVLKMLLNSSAMITITNEPVSTG
jgi:hypothetical protein